MTFLTSALQPTTVKQKAFLVSLKKLAITVLFLLYFRLFNTNLLMTVFEPRISDVGSDYSPDCATTKVTLICLVVLVKILVYLKSLN